MKRTRVIRSSLKIIVAVCLVVIAGFIILDSAIKKRIRQQFTNLSPYTEIKFLAVKTNFLSSSVSFDGVEINFIPYREEQQDRHTVKFSRASLQGISFYQFLFHKKLVARNFLLEDGTIQLDQWLLDKKDSVQATIIKNIKWPFKSLDIKNIELKRIKAILHSPQSDELLAKGNLSLGRLIIDKPGSKPDVSTIDLQLSDVNYPFSNGKIHIRQIKINSDRKTASIDSFQFLSRTPGYGQIKIPSIRMRGIDIKTLMDHQVLLAEKILVEGGTISIDNDNLKTLGPLNLKKIHTEIFDVSNLSIQYRDKANTCQFSASGSVNDLTIDISDKNDLHVGAIQANLSGVQYSGNDYREMEIKKITIDSNDKIILAEDVNIIPRIGKYEFGRKMGHQADWVAANFSKIEITKADIGKLLHNKLVADKILVGKSKVYIFRDRRLVRQQKIVPLPVETIKQIPLDIRVKTFTLASSSVEYEEYPRAGFGQTGVLRIQNASATISPLINHPVDSDPRYLVMNVVGSIMGSGTAHGTILMPMGKNDPYHIKGAIERLQLTNLNSSSENLGKIRIKSGFLDFLSFDFTMTQERSTGKIIGAYHNLVIQQLKKHTEEKNVADFASFMLRHVIIPLTKDSSLSERKRTGLVNYTRDPTRFVSYYFLQSLLTGVKKSFALGFLLPK